MNPATTHRLAWTSAMLLVVAVVLCGMGPNARAGEPFVIPSTGAEAATPPAVDTIPVTWLPGSPLGPKGVALNSGGFITLIGDTQVNYPVEWNDLGSGVPRFYGIAGMWTFEVPGVYQYRCACLSPATGKVYVVGPRALMTLTRVSPDNTAPPVLFRFDASSSFVTDFTAHQITTYAYDFDNDGTFEQVGPEPIVQASFAPGEHSVRLRVTDELGRTGEGTGNFRVPDTRPPPPTPTALPDPGPTNVVSGVKFPKANIKFTAAKKVRVAILRRRGLSVRVTGLTVGDRAKARVVFGKKATVGTGSKVAKSSTTTIRIRVSRSGRKYLKLKKAAVRMKVVVSVSGTDGFSVTKQAALRVSR